MIRKLLILFLMAGIQFLYAAIGEVVQAIGDVRVERAGLSETIANGYLLEEKDIIRTGMDSKVRLLFEDDTAISLGKNSEFSIQSYLFDMANNAYDVKFGTSQGIFHAVTGEIGKVAPERFRISTPSMTVGIRGTEFTGNINPLFERLYCTQGTVFVEAQGVSVDVQAGFVTTVRPGEPPETPTRFEAGDLQSVSQEGGIGSGSGTLDRNSVSVVRFQSSSNSGQGMTRLSNVEADFQSSDTTDYSEIASSLNSLEADKPSTGYEGHVIVSGYGDTSAQYVRTYGSTDTLAKAGTTVSEKYGYGSYTLQSYYDHANIDGFSSASWGRWIEQDLSSFDVTLGTNSDLAYVHYWVNGQLSGSRPSGTATYSGHMQGMVLAQSNFIQLTGKVGFTLDMSTGDVSKSYFTLLRDLNPNGTSALWVEATLSNAYFYTYGDYQKFYAQLTGSDVSSGYIDGFFFGTGDEMGGSFYAKTTTSSEESQGVFLTKQGTAGLKSGTQPDQADILAVGSDTSGSFGTAVFDTADSAVSSTSGAIVDLTSESNSQATHTLYLSSSNSDTGYSQGLEYLSWGKWTNSSEIPMDYSGTFGSSEEVDHWFVLGDETSVSTLNALSGSATYMGRVIGKEYYSSSTEYNTQGVFKFDYDFSADTLSGYLELYESNLAMRAYFSNVAIASDSQKRFYISGSSIQGSRLDTTYSGNMIQGRFYGDTAQEIGGVYLLKASSSYYSSPFAGAFAGESYNNGKDKAYAVAIAALDKSSSPAMDSSSQILYEVNDLLYASAVDGGVTGKAIDLLSSANSLSVNTDKYAFAQWGYWDSEDSNERFFGSSSDLSTPENARHYFVTGQLTQDMPTSGSATYTGDLQGVHNNGSGTLTDVAGSITMSADYSAATMQVSDMTIAKSGAVWAQPSSGVMNYSDAAYSGSLSCTNCNSGSINGHFYGPDAIETGGNWVIDKSSASDGKAVGVFKARK